MICGPKLARQQLAEFVSKADGLVEIVGLGERNSEDTLDVIVSLDCSQVHADEGGFAFNAYEQFHIIADETFPFSPPYVLVRHYRFAGIENVYWGNHICLYRSKEAEWDWTRGIAGFLIRLDSWIRDAACGNFTAPGMPVHPPVTYRNAAALCIAIEADVDTALLHSPPAWAYLRRKKEGFVEIVRWSGRFDRDEELIAAPVFLLPKFTQYEFPQVVDDLCVTFERFGQRDSLIQTVCDVWRQRAGHGQLLVIIAVPWETSEPRSSSDFHFVAWRLPNNFGKQVNTLSTSVDSVTQGVTLTKLVTWGRSAIVDWCHVVDRRAAITKRRDVDSPCSWFYKKSVAIWGCGALGGHIAELLVRAGVSRLVLYDLDVVDPGILVRQNFEEQDVRVPKVEALRRRLINIRPDGLEVIPYKANVLTLLDDRHDWSNDVDIVFDTTASRAVIGKLEARWNSEAVQPRVASLAIDHEATRGMAIVVGQHHAGGPQHVSRRSRIALLRSKKYRAYADHFFPRELPPVFLPERGCSSPTFVGSAADCSALAGMMLNCVGHVLRSADETSATTFCMTLPHAVTSGDQAIVRLDWETDVVLNDEKHGFQVRVAPTALKDVYAEIRRNSRKRGAHVETGGMLFGQFDEILKIVWIDVVSGPPPDSIHASSRFTCGIKGVQKENEALRRITGEATGFVGTWHTHPRSKAIPSRMDIDATAQLFETTSPRPRWTLVLIVGEEQNQQMLRAYVFAANDVNTSTETA